MLPVSVPCLIVSDALRCSGVSESCRRVQATGSMPAAFEMVHRPGSASVRSAGQGQSCDGISRQKLGPSRSLADLLKKGVSPSPGYPTRFQMCFSPSFHTGCRRRVGGQQEEEGETGEVRRGRDLGRALHRRCLDVPGPARAWLWRGLLVTWLLSLSGSTC